MKRPDRTSRQWFEEAVRCYVDMHQGCPWCHGSHRVYQLQRGQEQIYTCQGCDFQASHDAGSGEYGHIIGESVQVKSSPTMYQ